MIICEHLQTKNEKITKKFNGEVFSFESKVCCHCGAELWNNDASNEFMKWLGQLSASKSRARIQFKMSANADDCLLEILNKFPGSNKAMIVRALITVYFDLLREGEEVNKILDKIFETEYYKSFYEDEQRIAFHTDVKPLLYFDIESWSKLFDMRINEISSEAFHLMMSVCVSTDKNLNDFWKKKILPRIESIIKAA